MEKPESRKEYLYYTIAFFICLVVLLLPFLTHNRTLIHVGDTPQQHYPAFIYTGKYLQGLLHGDFHLYDFSIGYGEDIIESLNYYGLGDPLNLLSIFVTDANASFLFTALIFARIYLSGIGMLGYFRYHGYYGGMPAAGAVIYAFSLFSVNQGLMFYPFLSAMYLFPFLLLQMEKLLSADRTCKDGLAFAILIAVQSCCGFYFLYFQTILLGIYWLVSCCVHGQRTSRDTVMADSRSRRRFWDRVGALFQYVAVYYIAGIFMSAPILFPALHGFFQSARTVGNREGWRLLFHREDYRRFFGNLLIPIVDNDGYGLAIPVISIFALAYCLFGMRGKIREKMLIVIAFGMYLCPAFWRVMNGFSYGVDRWIYFIYFIIAYITVDTLTNYRRGGVIPGCLLVSAGILNILSIFFHYKIYPIGGRTIPALYMVINAGITLFLLLRKRNERLLCCLVLGSVLVNMVSLNISGRPSNQKLYEMFCDDSIKTMFSTDESDTQEPPWNRRDAYSMLANEGLVKNYHGTSEYLSIANGNIADFYLQFLISPGVRVSLWNLWGLDERKPLQILLGADSDYPLPVGVFYDRAVSEAGFQETAAVERQNLILDRVILDNAYVDDEWNFEQDNVKNKFFTDEFIRSANIVLEGTNLQVEKEAWLMNMQKIPADKEYQNVNEGILTPDSKIMIRIDTSEVEASDELYVYIKGLRCYGYDYGIVKVGGKEISVCNDGDSRFYRDEEDFLVRFAGDYGNTIEMQFITNIQYRLDEIEVYRNDCSKVEKAAKTLEQRSMQNVSYTDDLITGSVLAKQDGWLFLSIPYSRNWKAYVDGERMETIRADIGFTAVPIDSGEHMIVLKYRPAWFYIGVVLSGLTSICCVAVVFCRRAHSMKRKGSVI